MPVAYEDVKFHILTHPSQVTLFSCIDDELNEFLHTDAMYYQENRLASTHLAEYHDDIVGFFTLSNDCIETQAIAEDERDTGFTHPKYPALKIARFAVHRDFMGNSIGENMLLRIFVIAMKISWHVGCRIITVDAKRHLQGDRRPPADFYRKYGFKDAKKHLSASSSTVPLYRDFHRFLDGRLEQRLITDVSW